MGEAVLEAARRPPGRVGRGTFFGGEPRLEGAEQSALLDGLAHLDARLCRVGVEARPGWRARGAAALVPPPGADPDVQRRRWLDLAADLDEGADAVRAAGLEGEARAMEAVAGRLLEVLLADAHGARGPGGR